MDGIKETDRFKCPSKYYSQLRHEKNNDPSLNLIMSMQPWLRCQFRNRWLIANLLLNREYQFSNSSLLTNNALYFNQFID